jgi:hypothetical protein
LDISNQVDHGKGFEWAVASAFNNLLQISLVDTKELRDAETRYSNLPSAKQASFKLCAEKAAAYVAEIEGLQRSPTGYVTLSQDAAGVHGDVRDVILHLGGREIGISCKTNHEAFKHSRLSAKIDFVKKWGLGEACSAEYWQAVRPLFGELARLRTESSGKLQWSEIESYQERFYLPVLEAWRGELLRLASGENDASKIAATALCRYIIGRIDFWKIVSRSDQVRLYAFNTHSTLGTNRTLLPNRILGIDNFDGSQYSMNVRMNEGYQFNFRLHNASSRVEPSLKFDVQSEGLPRHIHQHDILI